MNQISDLNQFAEFINNGCSIVKFSLPGCNPCKQLTPRLIELQKEHPTVKLGEIDISKNDMGELFDIHHVPVVKVYQDGLLRVTMTSNFDILGAELKLIL